ncbi:hypothetical protein GCM10010402_78730 [Actinomadura luteofluorescens]
MLSDSCYPAGGCRAPGGTRSVADVTRNRYPKPKPKPPGPRQGWWSGCVSAMSTLGGTVPDNAGQRPIRLGGSPSAELEHHPVGRGRRGTAGAHRPARPVWHYVAEVAWKDLKSSISQDLRPLIPV